LPKRKNATFRTRGNFEIKKLIFLQLIEKYPENYGTRTFITVFTTARHFSVPCVQWSYVYSRLISYKKHETDKKCSSSGTVNSSGRWRRVFGRLVKDIAEHFRAFPTTQEYLGKKKKLFDTNMFCCHSRAALITCGRNGSQALPTRANVALLVVPQMRAQYR
jgi:hypothetical protein